MKHVSILPLYDATLTSIDSAHQLFSRINDFMRYQGKAPFYDIEVVGLTKRQNFRKDFILLDPKRPSAK